MRGDSTARAGSVAGSLILAVAYRSSEKARRRTPVRMGAATKSSSPESRSTTAGRNLPPDIWWNSTRIRTTSPGRRVMDQQFVYRVIGSVCRLESPPASRAPGGVVYGYAPLEYDLNLFPRRDPRSDLRRNDDLTVAPARCSGMRQVPEKPTCRELGIAHSSGIPLSLRPVTGRRRSDEVRPQNAWK